MCHAVKQLATKGICSIIQTF